MSVFSSEIPHGAPVIVVFVSMEGCGACEEYLPVFEQVAAHYTGKVPMVHVDAMSEDPETVTWLDKNRVEATPTVIVASRYHGAIARLEGVSSTFETRRVLDSAVLASRRRAF